MAASDEFGFDEDDTEFIAAATQVEASQNSQFQPSPRPSKRRCLSQPRRVDGADPDDVEWLGSDGEGQRLAERSVMAQARAERQTIPLDEIVEDADYYFPGELEEQDEQSKRHSKYKIHIPRNGGQFQDEILTQTQRDLDLSPSHFRGAVWKKPQPPPPPVFGQRAVNVTINAHGSAKVGLPPQGPRQTILSGFTVRTNGVTNGNTIQSNIGLAQRLQVDENLQGDLFQSKTTTTLDVSEELAGLPFDAFSSSDVEELQQKEVITISSQQTASQVQSKGLRGPQQGLKQMTIFGQPATQNLSASQAANKKYAWPLKSRDEKPTHHKLDEKGMETWVYPTNLGTIRDYQYNIVQRSLYHNTLVALPTGLGKTFIAATVMLNYYRWTKDAQIVFMAPTKPLIAQQAEACYNIVGIPRRDTVLMTGETAPTIRAEEWLARRVFFMTPQTVMNDLKTGICDPKRTVLVVVDEAHKATGSYAYTEVIKFYRRFNDSFRVHALTATPGSTIEAVQSVIDALGIARVELRTEQSLDIRQYTHEKHTETQVFDLSDEQARIMEYFSKALRPVLEKLCTQNAYWSRDPMALTPYGLNQARQKWMASDAGRKAPMPMKGMVNAIFSVLASLAHSIGLLKYHGITPFYSGVREFQKNVESGQSKGKYATQIAQSDDFTKMMGEIRGWTNNPDFIGHPKLEYLREVVLNHFLDAGEGAQGSDVPPAATRVMVFASYRDSTEDICRVLKRSEPMIRPHVFVGQAASKGSEGMDQKRQNAVIQDFKSGKFNTLIATSIGEEGLDIGSVDLIVCYDASASPIRMLQRIGRTGRKRLGKVVLLLMKGKEENDYAKAQDSYLVIQKSIADASRYDYRDEQSPRILPKGVQPVVDKRLIDIPVENSQPVDLNERRRKAKGNVKAKRPPKKFHMHDGVRTGFVKASKLDSDSDESLESVVPGGKTSTKRKSAPAKGNKPIAVPEPGPVQVPFLQDVLLNSVQQQDLERKYARTAGDDVDLVIRAPDATRFPESIRKQGNTTYVGHGRASKSVAQAMSAMLEIDEARVDRMKERVDMRDLYSAGDAASRLVNPGAEEDGSDQELPDNPLPLPRAKPAPKARPTKKQSIQRTTSIRSVVTTDADDSNLTPAVKKPRGRPRKKQAIRRTQSYGSAAAEGAESNPEPTPANMRLGTQGIDLGSEDTSGEEEDEEPDSELAEFVVKSDQPIEMASSSQQFPDDTQPSAPTYKSKRKLVNATTRAEKTLADSDTEAEESDPGLVALDAGDGDDDSVVEEVSAPNMSAPNARKRRVVEDDSDE